MSRGRRDRVQILCLILLMVQVGGVFAQIKIPRNLSQNMLPLEQRGDLLVDVLEVTLGDWFAFMYYQYEMGNAERISELSPRRDKMPQKLQASFDLVAAQFENGQFGQEFVLGHNSNYLYPIPEKSSQLEEDLKFPVTGVSFDQVQEYLAWREELMRVINRKKLEKAGLAVTARLFSPEEWDEFGAYSGIRDIENTTIYPDSANLHGCYLMNIRYVIPCESTIIFVERWKEGLYPGAAFFPDRNGLYDVFGNVAEMTSMEGVAKGGSYLHWASQGTTGKSIPYSGPEPWLGFRVVIEFTSE